jgi:putative SOS response-associated peptidase YedK
MCGRYAASRNPEALVEEFEVDVEPAERLPPRWNVAPTTKVYAVLERTPRAETPPRVADSAVDLGVDAGAAVPDAASPHAERRLQVVRWGLVPSWAKDVTIGNRMINARAETVAVKPAFRRAFARRRCLLPADGWYEWYPTPGPLRRDGSPGKPVKQPFWISPADGGVLAMAGVYELWRAPDADPDDPAAWLWTAAVLTTTADDGVGHIHDRMPLIVPRSGWDRRLDPAVPGDEAMLADLAEPAAARHLQAWPVGREVGAVRAEGPHLIEPIDADLPGVAGVVTAEPTQPELPLHDADPAARATGR